jgi:hypothetical protein
MAALAVCSVTAPALRARTGNQAPPPARPGQAPPGDPGMIPLTVPEVKRILAALTARPHHPLGRLDPPPPGTCTLAYHQHARLKRDYVLAS